MKLERREFCLNNIIGFEFEIDKSNDIFDQVADAGKELKMLLIKNGYYSNGPLFFRYNPLNEEKEITIFTTIGNEVSIVGENQSFIQFQKNLEVDDAYFYRHYDQSKQIPYHEIQKKVQEDNCELNEMYHVILDFYGDTIIDLYCEEK